MRIEYVEIKNGCQHHNFKQAFGPGVVLIIGSNGSGKSNIVNLIMRGLTGISQNYGKKEDDVMHGEASGSVKVEFSAGGQKGIISRSLKTASCKLEFGGNKFEGLKEVDETIGQLLGISTKILSEVAFARQGKIEATLFQTPAERNRSFQELFNTLEAEKLCITLQEELTNTPVVSKVHEIIAMEKQLVEAIQNPLAEVVRLLGPAEASLLSEAQIRIYQTTLQAYSNQLQTKNSIDEIQTGIADVQTKLAAAKVNETRLTEVCAANASILKDLNVLVGDVRKQLQGFALMREQLRQRAYHVGRWNEANTTLAKAPIDDTAARTELEAANAALSSLSHADHISNTLLRNVGSSYKCPVCTQDVPVDMVEQHRQAVTTRGPQIKDLTAQSSRLSRELQALTLAKGNLGGEKAMAARTKQEAELALKSLPEQVLPSDEEIKNNQQMVADYDAVVIAYNTDLASLNGVRQVINSLNDQLSRDSTRLQRITAVATTVTSEAYSQADTALRNHQAANLQVVELRTKQTFFVDQDRAFKLKLDQMRLEEAQLEKLKQWRQLMEEARVVLHRDQLPNLVAQLYIQSLNSRLARYLDLFEVPFTCRIRSDLSIECVKGGNHTELAERLSGGEKVMLGIAFRFAVYDLFASNLGLLILDEPTVFLDEDRIQSVYALLERVKSYSKAAGLQLIIVTHEKALVGVADRVIQL